MFSKRMPLLKKSKFKSYDNTHFKTNLLATMASMNSLKLIVLLLYIHLKSHILVIILKWKIPKWIQLNNLSQLGSTQVIITQSIYIQDKMDSIFIKISDKVTKSTFKLVDNPKILTQQSIPNHQNQNNIIINNLIRFLLTRNTLKIIIFHTEYYFHCVFLQFCVCVGVYFYLRMIKKIVLILSFKQVVFSFF